MMTDRAPSVGRAKPTVVGKMNFLKAPNYSGLATALNPVLSQIR